MADPFTSSRLIYRAPEFPEDVDFFYSLESDHIGVAQTHLRLLKPTSKKETEAHYKGAVEKVLLMVIICLPAPTAVAPGVSSGNFANTNGDAVSKEKPKPIPIGRISLKNTGGDGMHQHRHSMIGLSILEAYQNKGYGTEAIEWILKWGFQIAGLHRIEIGCVSWNEGARRLYQKMGFVPEGVRREHVWYDGAWHDIVEFAMLEHEWRDTRLKMLQSK